MLTATRRAVILCAAAALALPGAAQASQGFFALPEVNDEVLLVVTVGPNARADKPIAVHRDIPESAYREAASSAQPARSRRREANAFVLQVLDRGPFETFTCIPLGLPATGADGRTFALEIPYANEKADTTALRGVPMPRFARRAVRGLIDTSTGEISWADE